MTEKELQEEIRKALYKQVEVLKEGSGKSGTNQAEIGIALAKLVQTIIAVEVRMRYGNWFGRMSRVFENTLVIFSAYLLYQLFTLLFKALSFIS